MVGGDEGQREGGRLRQLQVAREDGLLGLRARDKGLNRCDVGVTE